MLDLDHFKAVNDTYGHETGNQVLKSVSRQLLGIVRDTDIVARYGGEEFAVICPETDLDEATNLAERMRVQLARKVKRLAKCPRVQRHGVHRRRGEHGSAGPHGQRPDQPRRPWRSTAASARVATASAGPTSTAATRPGDRVDEVDRLHKQVVSLSMQAKELCLQSVWAFVQALEARDPCTAWHSRNTTFYATCLARPRAGRRRCATTSPTRRCCTTSARSACPTRSCRAPRR
jgi:GGDEF domain-containing protein